MRNLLVIPLCLLGPAFSQTPEPEAAPIVSTHERAGGLLETSLKDKNPDTRIHAVQALGLVSPSEPYLRNSRPCWTTKTYWCAWPPLPAWWT